MAMDEYLWMV
uniref:Solute carrier family 20 member 2 n=1 Tax=Ictidomys tridecemlineatus TaxID=43179 RepID=I3MTW7_ICTTR